ncbi:hypothetical protein [Pseudomonas sp. KK4]|uniref:hypothetical protein n=1 Tax=Pseudomonas sp. KK4 TaxID=1855729 RepID=UPI00097C86C4|nr:hypothetical protein [Pseudomonas sp. KK4]
MTIPALRTNATGSIPSSHSMPKAANPTRLARQVSSTANSGQALKPRNDFIQLDAAFSASTVKSLQMPLYYAREKRDGDRIVDLASFSETWGLCYEHLTTETLTEREVLDVIKSGLLPEDKVANLKPVMIQAMHLAIEPKAGLTDQRLREIIDVVCHLPPNQWADALGEGLRFPANTDSRTVAGFIQTQLSESRLQRDQKIASGQLLTDAQWQCFRELIDEGPTWMNDRVERRLEEQARYLPAMDLEDVKYSRPSPDTAQYLLSTCWRVICDDQVPQNYKDRIAGLQRCLLEKSDPVLTTVSNVEETVDFAFKLPLSADRGFPLLAVLEEIERKSERYDFVDTRAPDLHQGGLLRRFLKVAKAVDDLGKVPGPAMDRGLQAGLRAPYPPTPAVPQQTTSEHLQKLAGDADALLTTLTHTLTGWQPVEALDPRPALEAFIQRIMGVSVRSPFRPIPMSGYDATDSLYAETTERSDAAGDSSDMNVLQSLADDLKSWLGSAWGYLGPMGAAVWGAAKEHPRSAATVGLVAAYAAVSEFHRLWFGDASPDPDSHSAVKADPALHRLIVDDLRHALRDMPNVQPFVARLEAQDEAQPDLIPDINHLLSQPVPSQPDLTYAELVDERIFSARDHYARLQISTMVVDVDGEPYVETVDIPPNSDLQRPADDSAQWVLEALTEEQIAQQADQNLQTRVLERLDAGHRDMPLSVPRDSAMNRPLALYQQTLNDPAVLAWFESKGLVLETLSIHQDFVSGTVVRDGVSTTQTFYRWDTSGWGQVSAHVLAARQVLDPGNFGLPFVDDDRNLISCAVILFFYSVVPPTDSKQAGTLASTLKKEGWPVIPSDKKAAVHDECESVTQMIAESKARDQLIHELNKATENLDDNAPISLSGRYTRSANGSPLADKCSKNLEVLSRFVKLPKMLEMCKRLDVDCTDSPVRISANRIEVQISQQWHDLTATVNAESTLQVPFADLLNAVKETGNTLYSTLSIDLQQVIDYRGFGSPKTVGEVRNVVRWLSTRLPSAPPLGDCSADLLADAQSPISLTPDDRSKIIHLEKEVFSVRSSMVDALAADLLADTSVEWRRSHADELLGKMFAKHQAHTWGQTLINALNWYGAGQTAVPEHNQKLLMAAIKLAVDTDAPGRPGTVAGYDIYQPKNLGRNLTDVRAEVEQHLIDNKGVSALAAPLVAHLFLADAGPEFLIQDPDKGIQIGTAGWMTLRLGTAIAEIQNPGCSRAMNTEQLLSLALLDPATPEQQLLFKTAAADILLTWAVMNGVVGQRTDASYSSADYSLAATRFASQRADLNQAIEGFKRPLVTRREIAIRELDRIFPLITKEAVQEIRIKAEVYEPLDKFKPVRTVEKDLVEAYMDGDLFTLEWKVVSAPINEKLFTRAVHALPVLDVLLTSSVDSVFNARKTAFVVSTKSLIAALPQDARQSLEQGEVTLFTLREETGKPKEDETDKMKAALRGRHGTLLRCELGEDIRYFEVFPGRMLINERKDLPKDLPLDGQIKTEKARVSKGGTVNVEVRRGTALPFDFSAYSQGSAPVAGTSSNKLIIEQLGSTLAATTGGRRQADAVPDSYDSIKTAIIVNRIINANYLQGERDFLFKQAKGQTTAEENRAYWGKVKDFLIQLIPFVGCTADLQSGDRMRFINGAFGCFTDLISALSTLAGAATRIPQALSFVGPITTKAFEAIKITGTTIVSLVNPLDGLPDLIASGGRAVGSLRRVLTSGVFALTESGTSHLQTCVDRLRGFFGGMAGAGASRLPRSVSSTMGRWNGTNTAVIQLGNKWYALDDNGDPIGRALDHSKVQAVKL